MDKLLVGKIVKAFHKLLQFLSVRTLLQDQKMGKKRRSLLDRLMTAFHFFGYWTVKIIGCFEKSMSKNPQFLKNVNMVKILNCFACQNRNQGFKKNFT
jgi:hypothetical protein